MPQKNPTIAPIPQEWLDAVLPVPRKGDSARIRSTLRAKQDMVSVGLGFEYQAYEVCISVLQTPGVLGEQILGMIDQSDNSTCETWAFLCPHPLGIADPVYAKIGLHAGRLHIHFFSFHVDLTGTLKKAVQTYVKKGKS